MNIIIGLIIVFIILSLAKFITDLENAPSWDGEHGFYTDVEIEKVERDAKKQMDSFDKEPIEETITDIGKNVED